MTLGLFFFSWKWGLSQGGGNYEQFQIPPESRPESDLIEHLWGDLKRAVHRRYPRNLIWRSFAKKSGQILPHQDVKLFI
ncbi:hypothetical protein L3Q82_019900, partial [Scortum barcoo]